MAYEVNLNYPATASSWIFGSETSHYITNDKSLFTNL